MRVKFVIGSREDYEWSRTQIWKYELDKRVETVLFSAVHNGLALQDLAAWILEDHLPVKLQTQLHKLIWPEVLRGV